MAKFVHLHTHSYYSMNDSLCSIEDLIAETQRQGGQYVALTDHGFMYGVYDFYKKVKKAGLTPIIGLEVYYTSRYAGSTELGQEERKHQYHLTILAKNNVGYRNLLQLASKAATVGQYYVPCVDDELLREHSEGLIVLSGCMSGFVSRHLIDDQYDEALEKVKTFHEIFGNDFYLEVQKHPVAQYSNIPSFRQNQEEFVRNQQKILEGIQKISEETGIPMVATNDVHYVSKDDYELHDIVLAVRDKKKIHDEDRLRYPTDQFYFKTYEEMLELFPADVVERSYEIAQQCNVTIEEIDNPTTLMPHFPKTPEYLTEEEYLRQLAYEGLLDLGWADKVEYVDRLEYELEIICRLGWEGYFLILWDIVNFCKKESILINFGRGSGGSSLVLRCLDIIKIDPIKHGLLFARFLSEHRISPPDVDLDFEQERRMEVVDYITQTYGEEYVAQIGTVSLHKARAAIKSVATALAVDFSKANHLSSLIPDTDIPLVEALQIDEVANLYNKDSEIRRVMDIAIKIQNNPSHVGVHAAGVLISPVPITNICPVRINKGRITTQWHMDQVEEIGMLKMDILGLKTLDVVHDTLKVIKQNKGIELSLETIPTDDSKMYDMLSKGDSNGVFQMESTMAKNYLKKMQPKNFTDIENFVALIRPGPLDAPAPNGNGTMVDEFIRRLHGESRVVYPHPLTEEVLKDTFGIFIYQESIMKVTQVMAGFTESEADTFRSIIGKKKVDAIPEQKEKFIKGCVANNISEKDAEYVFSLMETFGNYGFNHCLSGDTVVYRVSSNQISYRAITIKEIYQAWTSKSVAGKRHRTHGIHILGLVGNRVKSVRISQVWSTGIKDVYEVTTLSGKTVRATQEHRFLTDEGWRELGEISVGDIFYSTDFTGDIEEGFLIYEDKVVSIEHIGTEPTYDLEIEEHHNFVANGIICHNSHSVGYGRLSVACAWLRANYYPEFMASLLTSVRNDSDKLNLYLQDCHTHGTKVLPPSINISTETFVADGDSIRFGLSAVKGVGEVALNSILEERRKGNFTSLEDFICRAYGNAVNKTVLESFAYSGVFDEFGHTRSQIANAIAPIIKAFNSYKGKIKRIEDKEATFVNFDDLDKLEKERNKLAERREKAEKELKELVHKAIHTDAVEEFDSTTLANYEKEILGFYVTNHPLDKYRDYISSLVQRPERLIDSSTVKDAIGEQVIICGYVSNILTKNVKFGKKLEFNIDDLHGTATVIAYNKQRDAFKDIIKEGEVITVIGKVMHYPSSDFTYIQLQDADFPDTKPLPPKIMVYTEQEYVKDVIQEVDKVIKKEYDDVPLNIVEYKVGIFYTYMGETKEHVMRWPVSEKDLDDVINKLYEIDNVFSVIPVK